MKCKITQMTALVVAEHSNIDSALAWQIAVFLPKADVIYIEIYVEALQSSLNLYEFIHSGAEYNELAYSIIRGEIEGSIRFC